MPLPPASLPQVPTLALSCSRRGALLPWTVARTLALCLPEALLALATVIVSFLLARYVGVRFYFCLPEIFNVMAAPMLVYCLPLVSLYELTSRFARRYLAERPHDVGVPLKEEIVRMCWGGGIGRSLLVSAALLLVMGVFYTGISNLKPLGPLYNSTVWDAQLLRADTLLLGGHDWSAWLPRFHQPLVTSVMNVCYLSLFPMFGVTFVFLFYDRDLVAMRRLVLSMIGITLIGNLWHFLMPSLGDVYINPGRYADLDGVYVRVIQEFLKYKQTEILAYPSSFKTAPFIGIAAIPSLHVAKFLVYVLIIRKRSALLFAGYVLAFAGLCLSTLYFGWHYIVDSLAGAVLAVLVYRVVCRRVTVESMARRA